MKNAARRKLYWGGHFSFEPDMAFFPYTYDRNGAQKSLCVGMSGVREQRVCKSELTYGPQIHDCNTGADVFDYGQIMGNEQVGQSPVFLSIHEQIKDLGLDRYIQG